MSALSDEAPTAGLLHLASFCVAWKSVRSCSLFEGAASQTGGKSSHLRRKLGLLPAGFGEGRPCLALSQGSCIRERPYAAVRVWAWRGSRSMALTEHFENEE